MSDANRSITDLSIEVTLFTLIETWRTNSPLPITPLLLLIYHSPLILCLPADPDDVIRRPRQNLRPVFEDEFFAWAPATFFLFSAITLIFPEKLIID